MRTNRERAGRVKGAQRRSGPLTRPSDPAKSKPERRRNSWRHCGILRAVRCRVNVRCRRLGSGESGPTFPGELREKPRANHHAIVGANRVNAHVNVRLELALLDTAPQHIISTDTRGVSDPAGRPRGDVHDAQAGSLTPLPCCDTCAGTLTGRHKPPPAPRAAPGANMEPPKELPRLACGVARLGGTRRDDGVHRSEGPTAPWSSVPLLGPLGRDYLNGLMTRTASKSSNPGRSSE